jgi:putative component of toxin-antitoxin plasmid stabilization module
MLLAAARIEAESAQAQPLAAAEGRKHAQSITDQVRSQLPASSQPIGAGGELVPAADIVASGALALKNTVDHPDYVSADASRARLEMANQAGVLETALDAADTIGAQNSMEKMLAHQLAAMHQATMRLARQMNRRLDRLEYMNLGDAEADRTTVEACRLANTMGRMAAGYQQGLVALQRLRTGGTQRVLVQHVTVEGGGKAVVAGEISGGVREKMQGEDDENEQ